MLRVSSLGLKCRRHAPCFSQAVLRCQRVAVLAGKAPMAAAQPRQLSQTPRPTGTLHVEVVREVEQQESLGEEKLVNLREVEVVREPEMTMCKEAQAAVQDAPESSSVLADAHGQPKVALFPSRKRIRPLRLHSGPRRSTIVPSKISAITSGDGGVASDGQREQGSLREVHIHFRQLIEAHNVTNQSTQYHNASNAPVIRHQRTLPVPSLPNLDTEEAGLHSRLVLSGDVSMGGDSAAEDMQPTVAAVSPKIQREILLHTLATTESLTDAWDAYQTLQSLLYDKSRLLIPWEHLHRLARLISSSKPRTRLLFHRLLAVLSDVHETGGTVQLWEWNALIDFAGKGRKRTKKEHFKDAFDVYNDMINDRAPGATLMRFNHHLTRHESRPRLNPSHDIVTLTTLVNIAVHTRHKPTLRFATNLHLSSGIPANRITLLTYLRYFGRRGDLIGVRQVFSRLVMNGFDIGIDGVNAVLWAYGRKGRLDVSSALYAILRARVLDEEAMKSDANAAIAYLHDTEDITVPDDLKPDNITYTSLLQAYAYHGHLEPCLRVFHDFARVIEQSGDDEQHVMLTLQMVHIYRAIFIGFARHGRPTRLDQAPEERPVWNLETLEALFTDFLAIPAEFTPRPRTIYWILVGFARTSDRDTEKLREVVARLKERFPRHWGGRESRLIRLQERLASIP